MPDIAGPMKSTLFEDGKLKLQRSPEDRKPLIDRLDRIEGQVRGLKAMIQADRYCGDELQQIKAAIAALRRVAMMISRQHIAAAAECLQDKKLKDAANEDIMRIVDGALDI
jgi:CsoR family transcriptional regulator, copper-sensing transcriptional repressor